VSSLYASVLPFALGAAVSPTLLTLEFLILAGKAQPKVRAWFFVIGASVVLVAFGLVCVSVLGKASDANGGPVSPWTIAIDAIVILLLVALGIRELRHKKPATEQPSRLRRYAATAKAPVFLGVGALAMLGNFSTLVLYIPAVHIITRSSDSTSTKVGAGVMLLVITLLPLWLPVLAVSIVGHRSDPLLAKVNAFTTKYQRQVNAGICFVFAAIVAVDLLQKLTG
jgi:hypothetical protein